MNLKTVVATSCACALWLSSVVRGQAATITWTNPASGGWDTAANWNSNAVPGANDTAIITNAGVTVSLNSATTVGAIILGTNGTGTVALSLNNQTLSLNGPLTVNPTGSFTIDSGAVAGNTNAVLHGTIGWAAGALQGVLTLATNSTLNLTTGANHDLPSCTFTNNGTVTWTTGEIRSGNGTAIYNNGLWNAQDDSTLDYAFGGASTVFNNPGTFRKSGSTGGNTTFVPGVVFNNTGKLDSQTSYIVLDGGGNLTGGTATNLSGIVYLSAGVFNLNGTVTSTNVQLAGASLTGTNVISGGLNWIVGLWNGTTVTIATNSTLLITTGNNHDLADCTVTNNGTVVWATGEIRGGDTGSFVYNHGLWNALDDSAWDDGYGGAGTVFNNSGTFRKSGSTGGNTTFDPGVVFNNTGKLDSQTSYLVLEGGGNLTGGTATNLSGFVYLSAGVFNLNGTVTSTNVQLAGASLTGTNIISGGLNWIFGLWNGTTVTIATNSTLLVTSANNHDMADCTVTNNGTVLWATGGIRGGDTGTSVYNHGLWNAQDDSTFDDGYGGSSTVFYNSGTFLKSAGTNSTQLQGNVVFLDTGTLNVQTGSVALQGGGGFTNPASIAGFVSLQGGTFTLAGTVNVSAGGQMQLDGGMIAGSNVVMGGAWNWVSASSYFVPGSALMVGTNCVLTVAGGGDMDVYGSLTNAGIVQLQIGNLRPRADQGTGVFVNLPGGLVDVQADVNIDDYSGGTFINQGILRKSGGTNGTLVYPPFANSATVDVESSYLNFVGGGSLSPGTTMTGPDPAYLSTGTFVLSGSLNLNNTVLNGAQIDGTNATIRGTVTWDTAASYFLPDSVMTLATNGTLVVAAGSGDCDLYGAFTNAGTIQLFSGNLRPRADQGPGQLVNLPGALIDVKNDVSIDAYSGGTIFNQGILRKSGGTNGSFFYPYIFNSATVDIESSYLNFLGSGSFNPGTVMTGPDTAYLSTGTYTVNGNVNLNNSVLNGALITGSNGIISGTVTWSSPASYFPAGSTLTIATNGTLIFAATPGECDIYGALTNAGTFQLLTGTLRIRADQGAGQLINLPGALVDSKNDLTIDVYSGGTILNQGTFRKSGGTNSTIVNPFVFNTGTIDAQVANLTFNNGVSLTNGTVNFSLTSLSNYGTVSIAGAASLTGTVKATLKGAYQPIATNTFNVLSYVSEAGVFTATNLPFADAWSNNYGATVFSLSVLNARPTLFSPTNTLTVNELATLTATNTATDPDIPAQTLTFSLVSAPGGMTLNTNTGIVTWTPAQTNSPSTNTISVAVTDSGAPPLSATNSFTVVVREVNDAPTLPVIPTNTVNELTLLTVTNTATNFNIHATNTGYALISPPAGMVISTNGIITWTPAQTNSPGTNLITTVVTNLDAFDLINPRLTSTNTFTVIVREVNVPPTLLTNPTQTVTELTLLTVTNIATNSNIHSTNTGFALLSPLPGMSINGSGVFTWTPAQTNSPGTNLVTVVVANHNPFDLVNPNLTATNSFTVIVKEANVAPTLATIPTQTVNELTLLTVTNAATNSNIHATITGYHLVSPPVGMVISAGGIITWTPAQTNSPSTNLITTVVTNNDPYDLVNSNLTSTNTFSVVVKEVNVAPSLPVISTQTVNELTLLTVTNTATNSNIHSSITGYALVSPLAGMSINGSGVFTWTPAQTNSPSTNLVTTVVTNSNPFDLVNPLLTSTNTFTVVVKEANVAPTLPLLPTNTVNELTLLTVTNAATNSNIHATITGYHLVSPPAGMVISAGGIITWTPAQTSSPGTNLITTVATNYDAFDLVNSNLTSTNTFTVIVKEVNVPPTLLTNSTQTVNELALLTVTNIATNSNIHATNIGYSLLSPLTGMLIGSNGVFTWTPAQTNSPSTNLVTVVVTNSNPFDLVNPNLTSTNTFSVIVKEVNQAPILGTISTHTIPLLQLFSISNSATEPNIHSVAASYTLVSPPAGAGINASGLFSWTPQPNQTRTTNTITTVVTNTNPYDLVNPHLSATNSFNLIVVPNTGLTNLSALFAGGTNLTLNWPSDHTGWRIEVQTNALSVGISTNWTIIAGSLQTNQIVLPIVKTNGTVFYRMIYP